MARYIIVLALLAAAASAPVANAGSGVGMPSAAASSPGKNAQPDKGQTEEESCDANWPGCPCPRDLSELHIIPPEGMSLTSGQCSMQSGSISLGSFTFTGNLTLKGAVVFSADEMTDHLNFFPDAPPTPARKYTPEQWRQFAGALYGLRLNDWEKFGVPALSPGNPCMEADAVIKIRSIEALIEATDEAGNWLREYQVVKIGKFRKCKRAAPY